MARAMGTATLDAAQFIYVAASQLARSREALRRGERSALRAAVLALSHASDEAGAARMARLCTDLRRQLVADDGHIEATLDALADAFDDAAGELADVVPQAAPSRGR